MAIPKMSKNKKGIDMHYSVGALIRDKKGKYLLIEQENGTFAPIMSHIGETETPLRAIYRTIKDETNLDLFKYMLLLEDEFEFSCSRGTPIHRCNIYECEATGNSEIKGKFGWYSRSDIRSLNLDPVCRIFLRRMDFI